jgi:hypothetical protein
MRCAQLKGYVAEAIKLVEKSEQRDHFFEVAAHLIHGIPDTLFRLEKALAAAAMSAARMDYEEIKNDLKPEKAEELEQVFDDIRLRQLRKRRVGAGVNVTSAVEELNRIADEAEVTGFVHAEDVLTLIATLEGGKKQASETPASQRLREMAASLQSEATPSRLGLAAKLRAFLADTLEPVPEVRPTHEGDE